VSAHSTGFVCLAPKCGQARHRGTPVCRHHWRKVPYDLRERLKEARGPRFVEADRNIAMAPMPEYEMEYISAQHAILEFLETE